jgi:purine nucleosidase
MEKLIFDTDIGDDIDDALALSYAVKSGRFDILGVTTVYKNVAMRAKLATRLLESLGRRDIPVMAGAGKPLLNRVNLEEVPCQCDQDDESARYADTHAVDFIVKAVNENPGCTILTIGAMTNAALALKRDPSIAGKCRLVMMGGMIGRAFPEWNIVCDPEAARIVFESGIPIDMIGLDVTLKCRMSEKDIAVMSRSDKPELVRLHKLIAMWMSSSKMLPILHDPLAVGYLIDRSFVTTRKTRVEIETRGEFTRGVTVDAGNPFVNQGGNENALVAETVDVPRFLEHFLGTIFR